MFSKTLRSILNESARETLAKNWDNTQPADDYLPLPAGEYIAKVVEGSAHVAKTGTNGIKLTFEILEGEHKTRRMWHDLWLTPAALPRTKRDLKQFKITDFNQLDKPFPRGAVCKIQVVKLVDDDGTEFNKIKRFEVLQDNCATDPYAPTQEGVA